jgi:NADH-quinone oxidoreductase subunit I
MGHFLDALRALRTTLATVTRKPTTVEYPEQERPRLERYRTTSFALLHDEHGEEACIGCLQCERICPSQVITIKQGPKRESAATGKKRGWIEDFTLDTSACIFCELCVQVCPTDAIAMANVSAAPTRSREELVLTMQRLYENEKSVKLAWGIGSKLMAMQEDPAKEKKVAKPVAKPAATTPEATTPAATTPEATTPEATTPAATTPVATTPEATTPEATTPTAAAPSGAGEASS